MLLLEVSRGACRLATLLPLLIRGVEPSCMLVAGDGWLNPQVLLPEQVPGEAVGVAADFGHVRRQGRVPEGSQGIGRVAAAGGWLVVGGRWGLVVGDRLVVGGMWVGVTMG